MKIVTWIFRVGHDARDIRKYRSSCLEYFERRVFSYFSRK